MPQAIERLLAKPMIRPRLPANRLPFATPALGIGSVMGVSLFLVIVQCVRRASYTNGLMGPDARFSHGEHEKGRPWGGPFCRSLCGKGLPRASAVELPAATRQAAG